MSLLHPTYDDIHNACVGFSHQIRLYNIEFDVIVGVSRGGLMPANTLSQMLNVHLVPVSYSSKSGNGNDKHHANHLPQINQQTILIIDDICDSGYTLQELANYYAINGNNTVYTAAIYFKTREYPPIIPNFFWVRIPEDSEWVIFPWEKM